jgi:hypothetical protein
MKYPTIQDAITLNNHTLLVTFTNGIKKTYDITPLLSLDMFEPLKNYGFFKNVQVDIGGYGLFWNSDIDISESELWENGIEA